MLNKLSFVIIKLVNVTAEVEEFVQQVLMNIMQDKAC